MRPPCTHPFVHVIVHTLFGALAQLGERNTGSVEVSGSIPLGSTKQKPSHIVRGFLVVQMHPVNSL
jgi:hypothetical protein